MYISCVLSSRNLHPPHRHHSRTAAPCGHTARIEGGSLMPTTADNKRKAAGHAGHQGNGVIPVRTTQFSTQTKRANCNQARFGHRPSKCEKLDAVDGALMPTEIGLNNICYSRIWCNKCKDLRFHYLVGLKSSASKLL